MIRVRHRWRSGLAAVLVSGLLAGLAGISSPVVAGAAGSEAGTGSQAPPLPPVRRTETYQLGVAGSPGIDVEEFRRQAAETLADPKGWRRAGVEFREVPEGGAFTLWLAQDAAMGTFGCSPEWSCAVERHVVINAVRWTQASPSWNEAGGALRDYRHMVVNHEVGHWLGLGHLDCAAPGTPAPLMRQQSIDLQGCTFNSWPLDGEVAAVP